MTTFNTGYLYGGSDEELYKTNGIGGGTDADLDDSAPVDDTDGYTSDIDLTDEEIASIAFEFLGNNSTDDLVLTLYRRIGAAWTGTEMSVWSVTITNDGTQKVYPVGIGPHKGHDSGIYRFAMQSDGASTTFDMRTLMRRTKHTSIEQ